MSGWIPVSQEGWQAIAEVLAARPSPWADEWAVADLRWWVHLQAGRLFSAGRELTHDALREGIPGRPALAKRWHWTDHRVRTLLRSETWWDTGRWGPLTTSSPAGRQPSPADRQRTASGPPDRHGFEADNSGSFASPSPADRQHSASTPPADRHTRGSTPSPSPSPSQEQEEQQEGGAPSPPADQEDLFTTQPDTDTDTDTDEPTPLDGYRKVVEFWTNEVAEATSRPLRAPTTGSPVAKRLRATCRKHGEDLVIDAMRFYALADDDLATFLRARKTTLETILRHVDEYAELWREAQRARAAAASKPRVPDWEEEPYDGRTYAQPFVPVRQYDPEAVSRADRIRQGLPAELP